MCTRKYWQSPTVLTRLIKYFLCAIIFFGSLPGYTQTEFDSLKRNSQLDTLYQPSSKPTFVTEFAELKISGFVQPVLYFDNNNVLNNDLFVTSEIPTTQFTDIKFKRFHISANQSRLGFSFKFPKAGKNISAFIEGDFLSSTKGENAFFRIRHAYLTYGELLIGQTWTNFGDVNAGPNTLDLEGPNSMPASRVAQIRWKRQIRKKLDLTLAIEEPKADYTPLDSANPVKSAFPELVIKPNYTFKNGHWSNSLIYKPIVYSDKEYSFKKKLRAWGFTSSLRFNLPERKIFNPFGIRKRTVSFFGIIGDGTQGSVNDFVGLGYEAFPKDSVTLESLLYYGGYVTYSFVFKKRWSSTYVYSYLHQEKPATTNLIFKQSIYLSANAIYAINKYFTVGTEVLYGVKWNYDNTRGSALRLLCIMRLLF
jgi:DcaP outer membrane protein